MADADPPRRLPTYWVDVALPSANARLMAFAVSDVGQMDAAVSAADDDAGNRGGRE